MRLLGWIAVALLGVIAAALLALRTPDLPKAQARAKYTTAASRFVTVEPGLDVHVRDEGPADAPVLVLIHGSNASLQTWEPWVARLKDRYRVVTLDLPGHGLTGAHPRRDYTTASFVRVVEQIASARGLTRFALGGNSMGGWVAWSYAATHRAQVDRLILIDASHPTDDDGDQPLLLRIIKAPGIRTVAATLTPRWLIAAGLKPAVFDPAVMTPAMVDRYWELLRYPGNRTATIDRFAGPGDVAPPGRLDVAALILWGREDRFIPLAAADWFRARLTDPRLVVLDRVGHVPMEEAPDRALAPVLAFLAQPAGAARTAAK